MITITDKEFWQLAEYIKVHYGIHLKSEKKALVTGRLQGVLIKNGFSDFTQYYNYILEDKTGNAAATLVNKITTNHTYFMREEDHFDFFLCQVIPVLEKSLREKDIRIWSAGCSSGEEPYTLAMLMDEYFGKEKALWDTKILATDISDIALKKAREGIYSNENLASLPEHLKVSYFNKLDNENSIIRDKIKAEVIFRKFNLMEEVFPFKRKFHVIFCRNVMIYFDQETRKRLISKFSASLEYGGYLFIGHSETIGRGEEGLRYIKPSIYKKV